MLFPSTFGNATKTLKKQRQLQQNPKNEAISIAQNIPFPTLFNSKKELIREQIKEKNLEKELTINQLKTQVRTYF